MKIMKIWLKPIKSMGACKEAIEWGQQFDTIDEAWSKCEQGAWMLWLLGNLSGDPESESRRKLVFTACQCARLALPYVEKGETIPLKAIETAEKWAKGDESVSLLDVRIAGEAASAAGAYAAAARKDTLEKCANIVRKYYSKPNH